MTDHAGSGVGLEDLRDEPGCDEASGSFNGLGYPMLLGTSRKSVIGLTLDLPVNQREEGTLVTTVYGVQKGKCIVHVMM